MRDSHYWVYLRNWDGRIIREFPNFIAMEYARSFNTMGAMTITVPGYYAEVKRDTQLVVMRSISGLPPYLDANTTWFVTGWTYDFDTNITTINAADAITLLRKRIVAYRGGTMQATKTVENGGLSAPADDMMRAFVRENIGVDAGTGEFPAGGNRVMLGFQVDPDTSQFPITEKDAPFRNLLDVVTEIANEQQESGRMMLFDIIPTDDSTFIFRVFDTFLGIDRRATTSFGPVFGNVTDASLSIDWNDYANVAYVGGAGEDDARCVAAVTGRNLVNGIGRTPYERAEAFVDMRDIECSLDGDIVMAREGYAYIAQKAVKLTASGKIVNTPQSLYGRDFFYGDLVRCDFGIVAFDAAISSIHVRVSADEEDVQITLTNEEDL